MRGGDDVLKGFDQLSPVSEAKSPFANSLGDHHAGEFLGLGIVGADDLASLRDADRAGLVRDPGKLAGKRCEFVEAHDA